MPIGSSRCTDVFHWVGLLIIAVCSLRADTQPIQDLVVPVGFNIGLYTNITAARYLTVSRSTRPPTTLSYIGSSNEAVYALLDAHGQGAPTVITVAQGLSQPSSVAWCNGSLFVAEPTRLLRLDGIDEYVLTGKAPPKPVVVLDNVAPLGAISCGPDGYLYVAIGPSCSGTACACGATSATQLELTYCSIANLSPHGGGNLRSVIQGVGRRVGGLAFATNSGTYPYIAFTLQGTSATYNNAAGDDLLYFQFLYYGFHLGTPLCKWQGKGSSTVRSPGPGNATAASDLSVTSLSSGPPSNTPAARQYFCSNNATVPVQALGAGVAASGLRFYPGAQLGYRQDLQFPKQYINSTVFVAEHGLPDNPMQPGFRVAAVNLDNPLYGTSALTHINFASGWLSSDGPWGRPVDVQPLPDGSLLVSDDLAGAVYRITYNASSVPVGS